MAKGSRCLATAIARGANCQHLVGESILGVRENLGEEGSGRRAGLEEEKDSDRRSPQAGRHLTWWRPDHSNMKDCGVRVVE